MTSADSLHSPVMNAFAEMFRVFGQALQIWSERLTRMPSPQVSPDKSVMFRCTSSPFTKSVVWERLRDVVAHSPDRTGLVWRFCP